jgi:hypothetical protein
LKVKKKETRDFVLFSASFGSAGALIIPAVHSPGSRDLQYVRGKKRCRCCRFSFALSPSTASFLLHSRRRLLLFGMTSPSVPSSGGVQITRYLVLFNGTNYCDWVSRLRWHMRGLRLWEFLIGDILCPPPPVAPVMPTDPDKVVDDMKMKLLDEYDASMESYASQFAAYRTWLDEDAHAGVVLTASMEERLSADIVNFDHAYQMWAFLHERYEPTDHSTYISTLR